MKKIAWISGWAVAGAWFLPLAQAVLPEAEHVVFEATPDWLAKVGKTGAWDAMVGYSLGSLLMLKEAKTVSRLAFRVGLLAPVMAFPKESKLGGKVSLTQVKYLARWIKTERRAALEDFYVRAGLVDCLAQSLTVGDELLQWGLERLTNDRVEPPLPARWRAYAGGDDALLDAREIQRAAPSVTMVPGAGHHPAALMRAWAADFI